MKSWKLLLGLGAACTACCAIPLLGVASGMAAFGSALWACAGEFLPGAPILLAGAVGLMGAQWWRWRQVARRGACGCSSPCSPDVLCELSRERPLPTR